MVLEKREGKGERPATDDVWEKGDEMMFVGKSIEEERDLEINIIFFFSRGTAIFYFG